MSRVIRWAMLLTLVASSGITGQAGAVRAAEEEADADWEAVIEQLTRQADRMPSEVRQAQLATAHNNYAVRLAGHGQLDQATRHLQEAIRLDGTNAQFPKNLASVQLSQAYQLFNQHRLDDARRRVDRALALDPTLVRAHALLGEIEYGRQRLKEARAAWQRALELDPEDADVRERLQRVEEELPVESQFERLSQAYFDLRYEGGLEGPTGFDIRNVLLEARRTVGADFAHWPKHKIVVLMYSGESFRAMREETPDWVAGQYDGKIRIPVPGQALDLLTVKQILFHEYTHALVHDLTRGACPVWFNEGLAEYEGARHRASPVTQLTAADAQDRLVPWDQLDGYFSASVPSQYVALAYQQSRSIVTYLVERYGFWRMRRLLKAVADGQMLEDALADEFHQPLARIERHWREWLPNFLKRQGS